MKTHIFKIILFSILLFLGSFCLFAFKPQQSQFLNNSDYVLFSEWLRNHELKPETPALLSNEQIILEYTKSDQVFKLLLSLQKGRITGITESIAIKPEELKDNPDLLHYIGKIASILNTGSNDVIFSFLSDKTLEIVSSDNLLIGSVFTDNAYISGINDDVFVTFRNRDNNLLEIKINTSELKSKITTLLNNIGESSVLAALNQSIRQDTLIPAEQERREMQYEFEVKKVSTDTLFTEKENIPEITITESESQKQETAEIEKEPEKEEVVRDTGITFTDKFKATKPEDLSPSSFQSLYAFVYNNSKKQYRRMIMNNQIDNVSAFFLKEFPDHKVSVKSDVIKIEKKPYLDLSSNIYLESIRKDNNISFHPSEEAYIENNELILWNNDKIRISGMDNSEVLDIVPSITNINILHRSLGTNLKFFFLLPDIVSTTAIFNLAEGREILEFDSYFSLMMLLDEYLENYNFYFNMTEIKKVNGFIEFSGDFAALSPDQKTTYFAKARFHLNKKNIMDLIMFSFYDLSEQNKVE